MRAVALSSLLRPRNQLQKIAILGHATAPYSTSSSSPPSQPSPPSSPLPSTSPTTHFNPDTYLHRARQKFASQPATLIPDILSPTPSHLLTLSLADHVPALFPPGRITRPLPSRLDTPPADLVLPQGHHLVYFPPQLPPSRLLPDGTDPAHCPGAPFVRRMWAGGELVFRDGWDAALRVDGRRAVCAERVLAERAVLKLGPAEGQEKVFVEVERLYGVGRRDARGEEVRRLVFMRERNTRTGEARIVKAPAAPEFAFSLKPDATLLFHFSALTYNAHSIHFDPDYVRGKEGYRGLLVHGPLSLVLMLSALRACLAQVQSAAAPKSDPARPMPYVKSFTYRNIAPLYVNEEMRVCLRRTKPDGAEWDAWIEGPEGGLAVKGHAVAAGVVGTP
ncbi:uncharacterized protein THITE_2053773 [Thermothielavioides terrestris NRRL 8126]|uniref:MaoC-like domain-containing protein n=1 Tax=Thermothielavioides terrestris (strain ATCC 38088 / NRRL 8126) TaxID=578455 RepID=G2RAX6_THETT|nr:uncharacterized protein THITE_2053773 [Thermothielavioides terrestris NRRL 8126]AEO68951.1 hypothetical protein THITE_2053773 [Thermothielavioides terrestris NRRL 8126]